MTRLGGPFFENLSKFDPGVHSKIARVAEWLACSTQVLGLYPERAPSAGCVPMFFYYFLEHTGKRKPLETLIADFLVKLGVIKVIL